MTTTMRRLSVITATVALFLIVVWYFALFSPQNHKLTAAHRDQAAAEQKIQTLDQQISALEALQKGIPADTAKLATYAAAVPDNPELPTAVQAIQQAANASGVTLGSLSPSAPTGTSASTSSGTPQISMTMNVTAPYPQMMSFVNALNVMSRTLVIQSINMSQSGNSLNASIASDIYYAGRPTP